MEVGPYPDGEEFLQTPDLLEAFADREVSIFGIKGTFRDLAEMCPVDLNDEQVTLEAKNEFVVKAANEGGLAIEPKYEPIFTRITESHGVERKFTVEAPRENTHSEHVTDIPVRSTEREIDASFRLETFAPVERGQLAAGTIAVRQMSERPYTIEPDEAVPVLLKIAPPKAVIPAKHDGVSVSRNQVEKSSINGVPPILQEAPRKHDAVIVPTETVDKLPALSPITHEPSVSHTREVSEVIIARPKRRTPALPTIQSEMNRTDVTVGAEIEGAADTIAATNATIAENDVRSKDPSQDDAAIENIVHDLGDESDAIAEFYDGESDNSIGLLADSVFIAMPQFTELPAPYEAIEIALTAMYDAFENNIESTETVTLLVEEILSLAEQNEADIGVAQTTNIKLEELFSQLLEEIGIDSSPELVESFIRLTYAHYFDTIVQNREKHETDTSDQPAEIGTREFLQLLQRGLRTMRKAAIQYYEIGKSVMRMSGLNGPALSYATQ